MRNSHRAGVSTFAKPHKPKLKHRRAVANNGLA